MDPEIITISDDDDDPQPTAAPQNSLQITSVGPVLPAGAKVRVSYPGQIVATVLPVRAQIPSVQAPRIVYRPSTQFSPSSAQHVRPSQTTQIAHINAVTPNPNRQTHFANQNQGKIYSAPSSRVELRPVMPAPRKVHPTFASNKSQHLGSAFTNKGSSSITLARPAESAVLPGTGRGSCATGPTSGTPQPRVGTQRTAYPNRPSKTSSFLLFSQQQRERLLKENRDLDFCELGRTIGKLWRDLTMEEKNEYKVLARQLQDKKHMEWEKGMMQLSGPDQLQYLAATTKQHKRRRKSGYDVFMLEMRKNLGGGLSQPEVMKKIGEAWRSASYETRNQFELRADALNREIESQSKLEDKRREDEALNKTLQMIHDSEQAKRSSQNQNLQSTSLKNLVGNSNFLSSEPPNFSKAGFFQRIPAPPPLVLGGRSLPNDNFRPTKRVYPNETSSIAEGSSIKRLSTSSCHEESEQRQVVAPLCRLCGQRSLKYTELVNKPDIIQSVKTVLEIEIDIKKDELAGYPSTVCLKCLGLLTNMESFRSSVMAGQDKLKLLTVGISTTNETSPTPSSTKNVSDKIEISSVKTKSRPINLTNILSNKPIPHRTKEGAVEEVEMLEDELLRLEEQQKEDTKTLLFQDNFAHFFDDTQVSELKKIAGISDDDDDVEIDDVEGFVKGIADELDLITTTRENLPSPSNLLYPTENYAEITKKHPKQESEPMEAEKVFQMGEKNDLTEIYKYFRLKGGNVLPKHPDDNGEDDSEVEEIDCTDFD